MTWSVPTDGGERELWGVISNVMPTKLDNDPLKQLFMGKQACYNIHVGLDLETSGTCLL